LGSWESGSRTRVGLAAAALALFSLGCAARRTTHVAPPGLPPPVVQASAGELASRLAAARQAIRTLTVTADLEPTAGSVYSGVITEYHDVRAFILLESPDHIRMVGQAPVVRTTIFDMVSDGKEFRLLIPSKRKFIVGSNTIVRPAKNSLENMRPQHILDALLVPAVDSDAGDRYFADREREGGRFYYALNIVGSELPDRLGMRRRAWFDASSLELTRIQFFDAGGTEVEDVRYSYYQDYGGVRYPSHIELSRPAEDYSLGVTVEKASFNQPIPPEKFVLERPANVDLVQLAAASPGEVTSGQ
jgi:hypothetical protein